MWMSTPSSCVYAIFTYLAITWIVLLFCDWKYLLICSVVPYCPCGCLFVFEFDVLVSVLECGSTFSLRTQDVSLLIFIRSFALTFSLSSLLLIHFSFSLFLSLSLSLSPFLLLLSSLFFFFSLSLSFVLSFFFIMGRGKRVYNCDCYDRGLSAVVLVVTEFMLWSSWICSKRRGKKKLAKKNQT